MENYSSENNFCVWYIPDSIADREILALLYQIYSIYRKQYWKFTILSYTQNGAPQSNTGTGNKLYYINAKED